MVVMLVLPFVVVQLAIVVLPLPNDERVSPPEAFTFFGAVACPKVSAAAP